MRPVSLHEDLSRRQEGRGSSDRGFGIVFGVFLLLVGLAPLRSHHPLRWWALALSGVFLTIAFVTPGWLRPLNRVWTKLGLLMSRVVNPIVTGALFFLVVTPIALLARLFGKDPLRLATDPRACSYWIERQPAGPPPATMANQF
jgi:saxitoxin biosynthesis operon SxtJ-like protein